MFGFSQTWNYTFTDPCTLNQQTVTNTIGQSIALNYFGNVQSFTENDFTNGVFDNWINSITQINSSSPCESITQVIINTANSTVVATTLTVVTNIMSVMGGSMLPPAESINNSSNGNDSEEEADEKNTITNGSNTNKKRSTNSTQTDQGNQEAKGNQSSTKTSRGSNSNTTVGSSNTDKSAEAGEQKTESPVEDNEGASTQAVANSLANAIDGGDNESGKNSGSLIASGDIVVISNKDNSNGEQFRFVGSITHSNTDNSRIKGALFTYTSVTNDASVTLYKSWINPKKTFNLVLANTTLTNFKTDVSNTTTVLESFRFGKQKKYTGMAGINYTYGKLGKRNLQNLSSVVGVHRNFKVSPRISTSFLMLGVYSPFTQFYEGKWFSAGLLVVPFSSWDIKITKTFKYNISFTGVWQTSGSALNYQILTGGKINF